MPTMDINGGAGRLRDPGRRGPRCAHSRWALFYGSLRLRPLAGALAPHMKVLIWDRPNGGASDLNFR
jgi:hypothetical protein